MSDEMDKVAGVFRVTLGGVAHEVRVKTIKETSEFRRVVGPLLVPLSRKLEPFQECLAVGDDKQRGEVFVQKFLEVLPDLLPYLLGEGLDTLVSLPDLYEASLAEACAGASDDELVEAGVEVLSKIVPLARGIFRAVPKVIPIMAGRG